MSEGHRAAGRFYDLTLLILSLCAFLALTLYQIDLPGLHTDEAMEVLPAMQILRGQTVECYKDVCLTILGQRFPVMIYEYIAAVNAYIALPFFAAFGVNVTVLRLIPILQSAVAMVFVYLFAREFLNRRVATVALLLLAVNPSFVFWSRQGVFVTSVTIPMSMIGMWSLWRWRRRGKAPYLYLSAFLFGLGTSAKLLFWWMIVGIGLAAALLNLDRLWACWRTRSLAPLELELHWKDTIIAGLFFVLGLLPLIVFNVKTGSTLNYIRNNLFAPSYYNVDNANVGENLRERIKELGSVINGETFFYLGGRPYASWRYGTVFVLGVGALAFSMLAPRTSKPDVVLDKADRGKQHARREMLPAWVTISAVVVASYLVLRFADLKSEQWYRVTLILTLPATALGIVLEARRTPSSTRLRWQAWLKHMLLALSSALLFMLFIYLSWKLARWEAHWLYGLGVLAVLLAPWLRGRAEARKVLFPALVLAIALTASSFTPTGLLFTHLAILTPWPILVLATTVDMVARRSGLDRLDLGATAARSRLGTAVSLGSLLVLVLAAMLIYDDLRVDRAYHHDLARIGGVGDHTSASYTLVEYLERKELKKVVAMDWGIQDVVQFLSEGTINPPQLSSYEDIQNEDGAFALRVRQYLQDPDTVYVFHVGAVFKNRWEAFQQIAEKEGRTPVEIQVIYDRAAIPIFRLVRVP